MSWTGGARQELCGDCIEALMVRTIHVYKGVASVAAPAKMLETLMDETPHIFWINVSRKKKGLSIDTMYIYIGLHIDK